jgi:hypothetical protein
VLFISASHPLLRQGSDSNSVISSDCLDRVQSPPEAEAIPSLDAGTVRERDQGAFPSIRLSECQAWSGRSNLPQRYLSQRGEQWDERQVLDEREQHRPQMMNTTMSQTLVQMVLKISSIAMRKRKTVTVICLAQVETNHFH